MPLSLRTMRAQLFSYADVGADGVIDSVYVEVPSDDPDHLWWCSEGFEGGVELTIGATPEHRMGGVFVFSSEAPVAVERRGVNYAMVVNGLTYAVRNVRPARYGTDEVIVSAEHVTNLDLTRSVATPDLTPAFLDLTPETLTLAEGESGQLAVVVMNAAMDILTGTPILYTSSDLGVATVDTDGLVTAIAAGTCWVSAAASGLASDATDITVTAAVSELLFAYNAGDDLTDATFTRASTADYQDENDVTQTAGVDVPRDDHWIDGVRTLLLQPADPPRAADSISFPPVVDGIPSTEYWKYVDLDTDVTEEGINDGFGTTTDPITLAVGRAWESYKIAAGVHTLAEMIAL